jgi:hypothetical protein
VRHRVADGALRVSRIRRDHALVRELSAVERPAIDGCYTLDPWQMGVVRAKAGEPLRRSVEADDLDLNNASAAA